MALKVPSGKKIHIDVAREMIQAHKDRVVHPGTEKVLSFVVDKEVLQNLINQDGCEGVRIHVALKNPRAAADAGKSMGGQIDASHTLVLTGTDANGNPITANGEIYDDVQSCPPAPSSDI